MSKCIYYKGAILCHNHTEFSSHIFSARYNYYLYSCTCIWLSLFVGQELTSLLDRLIDIRHHVIVR